MLCSVGVVCYAIFEEYFVTYLEISSIEIINIVMCHV